MKTMRALINLTESVVGVPGIGMQEKIELGDETLGQSGWYAVDEVGAVIAGPYPSAEAVKADDSRLRRGTVHYEVLYGVEDESGNFVDAESGDTRTVDEQAPAGVTDKQVADAYEASAEAFISDSRDKYQLADYAKSLAMQYAQQESEKNTGTGFDPITGSSLAGQPMDEDGSSGQLDLATRQSCDRINHLIDTGADVDQAIDKVIEELKEQGYDEEDIARIITGVNNEMQPDFADSEMDHMGDFDDMYEAIDLNNGYDDIKFMEPGDFFPDGADGPVTSSTGPSGARQGDNPEQKKMEIAEAHKELVYNYRAFLSESKTGRTRSVK